jgi:deazaflavin-dependent oxidoreductase (nitroreductase family)
MTYLRPPAFTRRVVNPLVARFQTGGVATLTVSGRRTGRARTVPVIPIEVDGIRYFVSPYGESQWVRNLRNAGTGELSRQGRVETFQASEVPVERRPAIIAAYRQACRRDVDRYFIRLPDPKDHPVFRMDPTGGRGHG